VHCDIFDTISTTGTLVKYSATGLGAFFGIRACQKVAQSVDQASTPFRPELKASYAVKLPVNLVSSPFSLFGAIKNGFFSVNLLVFALILHKLDF